MPGDTRPRVSPLGEAYTDDLIIEGYLNNLKTGQMLAALVREALTARGQQRQKQLEQLAAKRGISVGEMRLLILEGKAGVMEEVDAEEELK